MANHLRTDRLNPARLETLRTRLRQEVDEEIVPSCQVAVGLDGEIVWHETFGDADDDTRYVIFSCTKAVVAGIMWQLFAEGSCAPADLVTRHLAWFGANGKDDVTIEQLLCHTSGFPSAPLGPKVWDTAEGRRTAIEGWRLNWEPGTRFEYHPTSAHWVLRTIIEELDGREFAESVKARITGPLGLSSLEIGVAPEDQGDIATLVSTGQFPSAADLERAFGVSTYDLGEVTPDVLLQFNRPDVRAVGVPGGGGVSNARDLASYYQALLHNPVVDGEPLWYPAWLADGTSNVRNTFPDPVMGYRAMRTLGLVVAGDDGQANLRGKGHTVSPATFGHNGAGGQIAWADPVSGLSFVYLTNGIDQDFLREARRTSGLASRAGLLTAPS